MVKVIILIITTKPFNYYFYIRCKKIPCADARKFGGTIADNHLIRCFFRGCGGTDCPEQKKAVKIREIRAQYFIGADYTEGHGFFLSAEWDCSEQKRP